MGNFDIFKIVNDGIKEVSKNDIVKGVSKAVSKGIDATVEATQSSTKKVVSAVEEDPAGTIGKGLMGAAIGVCAVAAAPFTGGGSVLAGASLAGALGSGGAIAGAAVLAAAGATGGVMAQADENERKEKQIREAKKSAFKDGINEGTYLAADTLKNMASFSLGLTALAYYFARCDGSIDEKEMLEMDYYLNSLKMHKDMPKPIKNELVKIAKNDVLSFSDVERYLDDVSVDTLKGMLEVINNIIIADGVITDEEEEAREKFIDYLNKRKKG